MVTLVISIVVMIIILSIVINSSINSVNETNLTKIDNEIGDLKNAVAIRITNYQRNSTLYPIVGQKIGDNVFEYIRSIERLSSSEIGDIIDEIVKMISSLLRIHCFREGNTRTVTTFLYILMKQLNLKVNVKFLKKLFDKFTCYKI